MRLSVVPAVVLLLTSVHALLPFTKTLYLDDVIFNSANSVRVWWRINAILDRMPETEIEVHQDGNQCGRGISIKINKTRSQSYDQVVWGVDSREQLNLCIRMTQEKKWSKKSIDPQLRQPPLITKQPKQLSEDDLLSPNNEDRTLTCAASGHPPPSLAWWINSRRYNTSESLMTNLGVNITSDLSLKIVPIKSSEWLPTDLSIQCEAQNVHGFVRSQTVRIQKHSPPTVANVSQLVTGFIGQNLILTCGASYANRITWYKNENEILEIKDNTNGYSLIESSQQLEIHTLQESDTATYKCNASNSHGTASSYIAVTTVDSLNIINIVAQTLDRHADGTHHYRLYCNASADPNLELNLDWSLAPSCPNDVITVDMMSSPDYADVTVHEGGDWSQCRVTCVARTLGMAICKAVLITKSGSVQPINYCEIEPCTGRDIPHGMTGPAWMGWD